MIDAVDYLNSVLDSSEEAASVHEIAVNVLTAVDLLIVAADVVTYLMVVEMQ